MAGTVDKKDENLNWQHFQTYTKRGGILILLVVILTVGLVGGLVGCTIDDSKVNFKNSVSYGGI